MIAIQLQCFTANEKMNSPFYSVPLFLWDEPFENLSSDAKLLYGLLLSRMELSRKNGWIADGKIYVIFPIREVRQKLKCCEQKAVGLMKSLEKCHLIERQRDHNQAYRIFLKQPTKITGAPVKNDAPNTENHSSQAMKITKYINRKEIDRISNIDGYMRNTYGCNQNVFLSDEEYQCLKDEFPCDYQNRIERLSNYMRSKNKSYSNHLATIRLWANSETEEKNAQKPDYGHSKGVSL